MTTRDPEKEQPERFARAVRAACAATDDDNCDYPDCVCCVFPLELKAALMAWDDHGDGEQPRAAKLDTQEE